MSVNYLIAGLDEAGRGSIAGPVVAACVILRSDCKKAELLEDSKKLTAKKRKYIFDNINDFALDFAWDSQEPEVIDDMNILQASVLAMNNAVAKMRIKPDLLLVDGNYFHTESDISFRTIVGGDASEKVISLASIIAKHIRDEIMINFSETKYPNYGFDKHKGYCTKNHFTAIEKYGLCSLHRKSFLIKFNERKKQGKLFK